MNTQVLIHNAMQAGLTPSALILSKDNRGYKQVKAETGIESPSQHIGKDDLLKHITINVCLSKDDLVYSFLVALTDAIYSDKPSFSRDTLIRIMKGVWEEEKNNLTGPSKALCKDLLVHLHAQAKDSNGRRIVMNQVYCFILDNLLAI